MPGINLNISPLGPIIEVIILPSKPRQEALIAAGMPLPAMQRGTFLIDTGASGTCIDPGMLAPLSLPATGSVDIHTPSTNGNTHACSMYDVMLVIPAQEGHPLVIEAMPVMETGLRAQGIDGLLGRDVLHGRTFIYNGAVGMYTLCY